MAQLERISVEEAAARLGVSARTVRNRLGSGELKGERIKTPNGTAWVVEWEAAAAASDEPELRELVRLAVAEAFGETVAPLVERSDELARENERLRAQIAALEADASKVEPRGWWRK